jgi:hypothetical protein
MPTAGALYFWASRLGGPAWGWFTGWFNLLGQIAVTAAIGLRRPRSSPPRCSTCGSRAVVGTDNP